MNQRIMRTTIGATVGAVALSVGVLASAGEASGHTIRYAVGLAGSNEVANGDPDGIGSAEISLHTGTNQVCWRIRTDSISTITGIHIHRAAVGVNGPIVVDFAGQMASCVNIAAALATEIAAGPAGFYLNVHTNEHPGGAVRGQLTNGAAGPLDYFGLTAPVRAYDSRQAGGTRLAAGTTRSISLVNGKNQAGLATPAVPIGAVSAQVIITITRTNAGPGFLAAHAAGTPAPAGSVINWTAANVDLAVGTVVPLDALGRLALTAGPTSETDVIVDVMGYFVDPSTASSTTVPV